MKKKLKKNVMHSITCANTGGTNDRIASSFPFREAWLLPVSFWLFFISFHTNFARFTPVEMCKEFRHFLDMTKMMKPGEWGARDMLIESGWWSELQTHCQ